MNVIDAVELISETKPGYPIMVLMPNGTKMRSEVRPRPDVCKLGESVMLSFAVSVVEDGHDGNQTTICATHYSSVLSRDDALRLIDELSAAIS